MGLRRTDPHTLAGAYAMDSVTPADRAAFEQHLAGCEPCRQEIRGLREATARLAGAVAVQPPPGMRDAALAAAARTRQLPPAVRRRGRALACPGRARGRWLPRLALGLAGALAALAIVLGVAVSGAQHRLDQAQLHTRAIATVLNAGDATMLTAKVSTGGTRDRGDVAPGASPGLHRGRPAAAAGGRGLRAVADGPGRRPGRRDDARVPPRDRPARWWCPGWPRGTGWA